MLRAGKAKAQEPAKSSAPVWPAAPSASKKSPDSEDSDNEERVPVPQYHASFQFDIEAALNKATSSTSSGKFTSCSNPLKCKEKRSVPCEDPVIGSKNFTYVGELHDLFQISCITLYITI